MKTETLAVMPVINRKSSGIPLSYREKMSDSTLGEFKKKIERLLATIDGEDEKIICRVLVEQRFKEYSIACWVDGVFLRFTMSRERREE